MLTRGLNDLEALDGVGKTQFLSHVGHILRLYEAAYFHHLEGTLDSRFWKGFERAVADVVAYPGMQATIELRRHHLSDEFANYLSTLLPLSETRPIFGEAPGDSE